jgi:hypothetical protein
VAAYGVTFAATVGTLAIGALLTALAFSSNQPRPGAVPDPHPLLFANPGYAMGTLLLFPAGSRQHMGRQLQLLVLGPGPASTAGPTIEAWQAVLAVQLAIVGISVAGAVLLLRGRRGQDAPAG